MFICFESMSKSTRTYNYPVIGTKIEFFYTSFHKRKTPSLFFCERVESLAWKRKTLFRKRVFWKGLSYFFLVVYEGIEISIWEKTYNIFYYFFSSSYFYKHFMEYGYFHIGTFFEYQLLPSIIFFCLLKNFCYYFLYFIG